MFGEARLPHGLSFFWERRPEPSWRVFARGACRLVRRSWRVCTPYRQPSVRSRSRSHVVAQIQVFTLDLASVIRRTIVHDGLGHTLDRGSDFAVRRWKG